MAWTIAILYTAALMLVPLDGSTADLEIGDVAPEFAMPGSDDKVHKLSDYRGQTVVLAWFPKAFTKG
jgi:thioredoxin-dependent peroxiredoxin